MNDFIIWLYDSFFSFIETLTGQSVALIDNAVDKISSITLSNFNINLALFSDTPILASNGYDLAVLFFSVFYTVIFIVIVYKIIKKVIVKITWWNRW